MSSFFIVDNTIKRWNNSLSDTLSSTKVGISDPVSIEYLKIKIKSSYFDFFGKSEVMVINYLRNRQTKERALESIIYYDDDAYVKDNTWIVGPFDPGEYGNPVCFYTPGYQGTAITISTLFWEIDDPSAIRKGVDLLQAIVGLLPVSPIISIADTTLGFSSKLLNGYISHRSLCPDHTIEFRLDLPDQPLLVGKYICFPDKLSIKDSHYLCNEYIIESDTLIHKDTLLEYGKSYFILRVSNESRENLADYDFLASSADLLKMVTAGNVGVQERLLDINRDSYDLQLIEKIKSAFDLYSHSGIEGDKLNAVALYRQLDLSKIKGWFNSSFPIIGNSLK